MMPEDKKLLLFSRNLTSVAGGSERSLLQTFQKVSNDYDSVSLLTYSSEIENRLFSGFEIIRIPKRTKWLSFLPYVEYFFIKREVSKIISKLVEAKGIDEIWCQNTWAPMAAKAGCSVKVFLRDEAALGIRPIYFSGRRGVLSIIHRIVDFVFWYNYKRDLRYLYSISSEVVANSNWVAKQFELLFRRSVTTEYPDINSKELKRLYNDSPRNPSSVVMLGSEYVKGFETFIRLARVFPGSNFIVFSKDKIDKGLPKNLQVKCWSSDRSEPYRYAKVVLVPSVWNEAYGRVAAEAKALNIPVIVSDKGGLPEAVNHDALCIASGFYEFKIKLGHLLDSLE